jgi:HAMP domain-containing protein
VKLLAKFNLIFIVVFGTGLAIAAWLADGFLKKNAHDQVIQQARLMMESTLATRHYTSSQIKPLLLPREERERIFLPQTVPAYAATEVFKFIHAQYSDYAYKEATLNPTNPSDRAVEWEADIVNNFRNHRDLKDFVGERPTPTGTSLFFARPIEIKDPGCLECHNTAAKAPIAVVRQYGRDNGFGWKMNEIIGAQIVSVPEAVAVAMADKALKTLLIYLVGLALITLVVLDLVLVATVTRPVSKLSKMADEISQGNVHVQELPVKGHDEISVLAGSFNRMQRSLQRALKLLEGDQS